MKTYLVGGAVRDGLLGRPSSDRDWLATGIDEEGLLGLGFKPVGSAFGVFLHPETHEEYALPRGPDGTLEGDLAARDLTINAMARDTSGQLIDPHGGEADIEARVIRHVGPAFAEDPARVFRVARFTAELTDLGFSVAPETTDLMTELVRGGGLRRLSPDRVWAELAKLLSVGSPEAGIDVLTGCGAVGELLTDWAVSDGVAPLGLDCAGGREALAGSPPTAVPRLTAYLLGLRGTHASLEGLTVFLRQCRLPKAALRLIEWTQDGTGGAASLFERRPEEVVGLVSRILRRRDSGELADFVAVASAAAPASGRAWGEEQMRGVREVAGLVASEGRPRPEDEGVGGDVLASRIRSRQIAAVGAFLKGTAPERGDGSG